MKKIIKNKLYDTDTAKLLATACSDNHSPSDFAYWTESLYRKKNGELFLYGEGGPASRYARQVDNCNWSSGSQIKPISYDYAREWAERELDASEYIKLFGEPDEGTEDDTETMTIVLPVAAAWRIRQEAYRTDKTIGAVIAEKFL